MASSPLALACRYGAPPDTVEAILAASKGMVRRCIPNRGTPLHEAIMTCDYSSSDLSHEMEYVRVIQLLLQADEELQDSKEIRATLRQDVDGNVPLHLLVRQAFKNYLGGKGSVVPEKHPLITVIRNLIESSPEAVAIPDCTEYEETPLIFVLKSSIYANELRQQRQDTNTTTQQFSTLTTTDTTTTHNADLERRIFVVCKIMLSYYPQAASFVNERSGYTAVHSAVFHGRCCDTIRLVLKADADSRKMQAARQEGETLPAAIRANSLGELPLHFAAMRGECTRSLALLSQAAPSAVLKRDLRLGMTPLHWLWVRFVDTMFDRFGGRRFEESDEQLVVDCCEHTSDDGGGGGDGSKIEKCPFSQSSLVSDLSGFEAKDWSTAYASKSTVPLQNFQCKYSIQNQENDNNFDQEYHVRTQAIDPSVDFMDMRYICPEHREIEGNLVNHAILMLRGVRRRHQKMEAFKAAAHLRQSHCQESEIQAQSNNRPGRITNCPFVFDSYPVDTRLMGSNIAVLFEEQVISLFWAKVTSLLQAAAAAQMKRFDYATVSHTSDTDDEKVNLLHIACSAPCTPLAIVRLCAGLYPEQLRVRDQSGKLPLHHVACRLLDLREFPKTIQTDDIVSSPMITEEVTEVENQCARLRIGGNYRDGVHQDIGGSDDASTTSASFAEENVVNETAKILGVIIHASPPQAARTYDAERRLPLHCAIDTFVKATTLHDKEGNSEMMFNQNSRYYFLMNLIQPIILTFPGALGRRDGRTGLYPFMQAAATATESSSYTVDDDGDETAMTSIVYTLLRENPSLVAMGIVN